MTAEPRRPIRAPGNVTGNALDGDRLLTIQEVADFLNLPVATIRKQRVTGDFAPGYRLGKHVRWRRSVILEWLEDHADEV